VKKRGITAAVLLLLMLGTDLPAASAYSYAEVMAGLVSPTGLVVHRSKDADRVTPGSFGTAIVMDGLFPLLGRFSFSPSFGYLSTNGDVRNDPISPSNFDIRFQQTELACDLLWQPGGLRKFRLGTGISAAWWSAVEDKDLHPYYYRNNFNDTRVVRGQSALLRGVAHFMLRNPEVSGISAKLIAAYPLTELLKIDDSAASGYIGLNIGFSMILN
jgi:hypothetical protein